ncbi:MAG: hypothetical protein BWX98_00308 [Candidatus Aminicenantes bacterium ADurb.Bin147]|jgi:hypothetical protein|nr:MAG: hypothetical protein BWX98_00308 [Candidatus Aminicenantes bacterium ADurb.Bin147]
MGVKIIRRISSEADPRGGRRADLLVFDAGFAAG